MTRVKTSSRQHRPVDTVRVGTVLVGLLLISTACSSSGSTTRQTTSGPPIASTTTPISSATSAVTVPTTTDPDLPPAGSEDKTFVAAVTFETGPFTLGPTTAGLAGLAGYTATLTVAFTGTNAGQPSAWTNVYTMAVSKAPKARQLTTSSPSPADPDRVYRAEVDGVSYTKRADKPCAASVIDASGSTSGSPLADSLEPASQLSTAVGADPAGAEDANGVPANHYRFDEHALAQSGVAVSKGDVWVATTGGYLVKYTSTTTAKSELLGDGIEGTLTYDYELTGIGQPAVVSLPDDCPAGLVTAPMPPGATNVANAPGSSSFDTAASPTDVMSFYQGQLAPLGWTPNDDLVVDDTSAHLSFVQGAVTLSVDATTDAGVTTVTVTVLATRAPAG